MKLLGLGKYPIKTGGQIQGIIKSAGLVIMTGLTLMLGACGGGSHHDDSVTAQTTEGTINGFVESGVRQFRGIPYASPPVGALRWMPPTAAAKRSQILDTKSYRSDCAQSNTLGVFGNPSTSEDCLYANIFTPKEVKTPLPVMVWIHGGGNFNGSGSHYDGSKLVRDGNTVVVTFNYRVNIFGFFAHPAITAEGHANSNYGIMDQQQLLRWVKQNIANFGGDPNNVTIFGESAGGFNVMAHYVAPASNGLFQKAISESSPNGVVEQPLPTLAAAEAIGQNAINNTGCTVQTADCLRSLTAQQLLQIGGDNLYSVGVIVDGTIIPESFITAIDNGNISNVPLLVGLNKDEWNFFAALDPSLEVAPGTYAARINTAYGANAAAVLAQYPEANYPSPSQALVATITDSSFACSTHRIMRKMVQHVPVYAYEFADRTAPSYAPESTFLPHLAAHTLEMQYLFPLYKGGSGVAKALNASQEILSNDMVSYWTNFAKSGTPNAGTVPTWPAYDLVGESVQSLQLPRPQTITNFADSHNCALWDSI
ncbi:carboxylesterase/lipase family protein [Methylophilus sp. 3sh_L]|uniref:carboxylesterase/lipase family protein n=1 Tax=Methylophilus sp. 3sh_L TaxID=3377114 RepID=UPI00398EE297